MRGTRGPSNLWAYINFPNSLTKCPARSNLDVSKKLIDTVSGGRMIYTQAVRLYILNDETCRSRGTLFETSLIKR